VRFNKVTIKFVKINFFNEKRNRYIIIIITVSFMQGIYTYIPERKKHVCKEYNVAACLSLLFMAPISLVPSLALMCFYTSTFRSVCAVPIIIIIIIIIILNNTNCRICGSESCDVKNSSPLGYGNIWIDVSMVKV
jgi:uncharacterized BrkB/YihY/UPF0761 family membrane protein